VIYLAGSLLVILVLAGWWLFDRAWQDGYRYGYAAGLLTDDKLNITFEEWE
jgi:hypothetical protein